MKNRTSETRKHASAAARSATRITPQVKWPGWQSLALAAAAVAAVFWAYSPSMRGVFLFDDLSLPNMAEPLGRWLHGVRPAVMFTYWINAQISGNSSTLSYHVFNVVSHCLASGSIFLIVRRLLEWASRPASLRSWLAASAAGLFLLHPVQTEAVAYVAGRSEGLSVLLVLAGFTTFLYRRNPAVRWIEAGAVIALFAVALLAKEHTIVFPLLLLLSDYWWSPGFSWKRIWTNRKLHLLLLLGALAAVGFFWELITKAGSAGFALKDFTWYQYFFTQCRALLVYVGIFVFPVNLNADWDFPVSKSVLDHGALLGLLLLVGLGTLAWQYRRRFPLASFGFFAYLLLMSPTSSFLPIKDPIAERRLYFSMLGLLLILVDGLSRLKVERRALAAGCMIVGLLAAGATHARARVWADPISLWEDTVRKSPNKSRAHFQLAFAYDAHGRYGEALAEYQKTAQLAGPTYDLLVDWALAYDHLGQPDQAIAKLRQAAVMAPTAHVYTQIGMIYARRSRWAEAMEALAAAERIDARFAATYVYQGDIHLARSDWAAAAAAFQRALALDPTMWQAREGLGTAQAGLRGGH